MPEKFETPVTISENGQVTIPKEIRKGMGIMNEKTMLYITVEDFEPGAHSEETMPDHAES